MSHLSIPFALALAVIARADEKDTSNVQVIGGNVERRGKSVPLTQAKAKSFRDTLLSDKESYQREKPDKRPDLICRGIPSDWVTVVIDLRRNERNQSQTFFLDDQGIFHCLNFHWNKERSQKALEVLKKPE